MFTYVYLFFISNGFLYFIFLCFFIFVNIVLYMYHTQFIKKNFPALRAMNIAFSFLLCYLCFSFCLFFCFVYNTKLMIIILAYNLFVTQVHIQNTLAYNHIIILAYDFS